MDLGNIILNKSEKDKYHMIHFYVESNEQNKLTQKIEQTHRYKAAFF